MEFISDQQIYNFRIAGLFFGKNHTCKHHACKNHAHR